MKGLYKRYQGWCGRCDRCFVENGKKCPECGFKSKDKITRYKQLKDSTK